LDRSFKQDLSDQDLEPIRTYFEATISPQVAAP